MKKCILVILMLLSVPFIKAQNESKTSSSSLSSLATMSISVTIGGDFIATGTFPAMINERVDAFVTRMYNQSREMVVGNITDPLVLDKLSKKLDEYSLRNVVLKRSSGETLHLDLLKFRLVGDFKNNPYLKNDDVIIFNNANLEEDFFSISGAVNRQGKFPFIDGDKLSDALLLARGISKAYENVTKAMIYRLSANGEERKKIVVELSSDYSLQRGDRIVVLADENQRKEFNVTVMGEIKQPGIIPITKGSTTLKEAIEDAGGFTDRADLKRAKLVRGKNLSFILEKEFGLNIQEQSVFFKEYPNSIPFEFEKSKMLRTTTLTEKDTAFFTIDETLRQLLNESSFNLDSVLDGNSATANLKLRDGDYIIIPQRLNTVYVYGQVVNPGNVNYADGQDYTYYLKSAGGLTELNKGKEIAVIKGTNRQWITVKDHDVKIEPGDFIYVPKDPNVSFDYYLGKIGTYIGIIGSTATIILLMLQINK
jgi:protein involved in polysaccharide export with SLBB domain